MPSKKSKRSPFEREVDEHLCEKYDIGFDELLRIEPEVLEQMRSDVLFEFLAR